ncbi:Putative auto-transporter adhesin, head GIN domain [Flavobacterium swingsii]|uniref:Putative auto-transporter adhesin, head GIN domain n=1 Tax=Flavobacterium swingsii TaxID=498292 RepID=A0A1I0Y7X6_9FLAO|nr:head GIN domain-containing protein [Flavobacterium swingsii]SFB08590.1 Putative auto-transporter adhesin, head GIN domain [Flavobacterium swingsii]
MRKLFIISFFILANVISAQVTKNLGDFTKVTAFDKISVQLIKIDSTENKIEISGDLANEVEIITIKNELKIRMSLSKALKGNDIVAKVYFKNLEALEANEGSYISCDSVLSATNFNLIAKEGSQIKVNISSKKISVKSMQGSVIKLEGTTQNLEAILNTAGALQAKNCTTSQATVSITAGGDADFTATDYVDAKVKAGGTITIYGNPKQVDEKTILGGSIIISKR